MIPVDTKWLFDDARGRKTFEAGEEACRSVIECYIRYRIEAQAEEPKSRESVLGDK